MGGIRTVCSGGRDQAIRGDRSQIGAGSAGKEDHPGSHGGGGELT